jgi:DNA-binding MarR family transcriptional regulator
LYFTVSALARDLGRMAEETFSPTGLAPSYGFLILTVCDEPGIQPGEIAKVMHLTPSTVTRLIEKLESKKLLKREYEGKYTKVFPTAKAEKLYSQITKAWNTLIKQYVKILSESTSKKLTKGVNEALSTLEDA